MKKVGILGGMSWESTSLYYTLINQGVRERLGGLHSAKLLLSSVNFADIAAMQKSGDWEQAGSLLLAEAKGLEAAGAEAILIATNTMHKVLPDIEPHISVPFIHIADATGRVVQQAGHTKVGFIGTQFSMEEDFYIKRLQENYGLDVVIPEQEDRALIHRVIFEELCQGHVKDSSRQQFLNILEKMRSQGAQCIIEGCTEITLLVQPQHTDIPLFDTTKIHAEAAVTFALDE
ncbi:aspartate/glutamate racemase family protein [Rhodanobacter aciditrophus]|uniref:Aspartate/glutamate racemase family protein n=1 Tax=Rhodanobacter aciditrophus TaxID=1623218 RepID=A0ABW4AW24_9GAMM